MEEASGYDFIGDVHGQGGLLFALLGKLGYERVPGSLAWRHPRGRRPVFLGDLIDRGPDELAVVRTVRAMEVSGAAHCVLGNHEYNDLCDFLGLENFHRGEPHVSFLGKIRGEPDFEDILGWLFCLPLWLDLGPVRAVHACWDPESMKRVAKFCGGNTMSPERYLKLNPKKGKDTDPGLKKVYKAADRVLSGALLALPPGVSYISRKGKVQKKIRTRWWEEGAKDYRTAAFMEMPERVPALPLPKPVFLFRPEKPTFFGHYNQSGKRVPAPVAEFAACVDFGAGSKGPLTAYRWSLGDAGPLRAENFVQVFPERPRLV